MARPKGAATLFNVVPTVAVGSLTVALASVAVGAAAPNLRAAFGCELNVVALPTSDVVTVGDCKVAIRKVVLTLPRSERGEAYSVQNGSKSYQGAAPKGSGTRTLSYNLPSPLLPGSDHEHFFDTGIKPAIPPRHSLKITLTTTHGATITSSVTVVASP
jgi:hypothetical protein